LDKYSYFDVDSVESTGDYTVQAGFGWTNGVVLWVVNAYGGVLNTPQCPNITTDAVPGGNHNGAAPGVGVSAAASLVLAIIVGGSMIL